MVLLAKLPPAQLPSSNDLPASVAAALRATSRGSEQRCAVGGVVAPVLAAVMGMADGLGLDEKQRVRLHETCRRELQHLASAIAGHEAPEMQAQKGKREDPLEVLLAWCSTPVVPTYSAGVQLALGLSSEEDPAQKLAADLAWVFRLLCARARVRDVSEAPMFFAACKVLCSGKAVSEVAAHTGEQRPISGDVGEAGELMARILAVIDTGDTRKSDPDGLPLDSLHLALGG